MLINITLLYALVENYSQTWYESILFYIYMFIFLTPKEML